MRKKGTGLTSDEMREITGLVKSAKRLTPMRRLQIASDMFEWVRKIHKDKLPAEMQAFADWAEKIAEEIG
ncbi:MAG: hypothetical protein QMD00_05360 [Hadesarchaea archaeon]|nr:hypothetical protein [Hadesarchaea archaeon]